jgi:hypothetical protein
MWRRFWWVVLLLPVTLYLVFWPILFAVARFDEAWRPAWIGDDVKYAEVVGILPGAVPNSYLTEIIPFSTAKAFALEHPNCTFLIPKGHEDEIAAQLRHSVFWVNLEAKHLSGNQQKIKLEDGSRG